MQFATIFASLAALATVAVAAPVADNAKVEARDHYCNWNGRFVAC